MLTWQGQAPHCQLPQTPAPCLPVICPSHTPQPPVQQRPYHSPTHTSDPCLWLGGCPAGAAACTALVSPVLQELHLSHNAISTPGVKALLGAVPLERPPGAKPLWLRIEWNHIDSEELTRFVVEVGVGGGEGGVCKDAAKPKNRRLRAMEGGGGERGGGGQRHMEDCTQVDSGHMSAPAN